MEQARERVVVPGQGLSEAARKKVDEYIAGIVATRDGVFDVYYIEFEDGLVEILPETAESELSNLVEHFRSVYPDIDSAVRSAELAAQ